jgi:hypothetical protein
MILTRLYSFIILQSNQVDHSSNASFAHGRDCRREILTRQPQTYASFPCSLRRSTKGFATQRARERLRSSSRACYNHMRDPGPTFGRHKSASHYHIGEQGRLLLCRSGVTRAENTIWQFLASKVDQDLAESACLDDEIGSDRKLEPRRPEQMQTNKTDAEISPECEHDERTFTIFSFGGPECSCAGARIAISTTTLCVSSHICRELE